MSTHKELVPDTQVRKELGNVTTMTMHRWTHNPTLNFPPAVKINNRNYRVREQLEEFKERLFKRALAARGGERR